ncbi:MAG: hypothetical protein K2X29_11585, partial [Candidatus Obscuribacterales bacterium]|nr:hypothetical protein [Candidatus Obscuribacterales bacterium]
MLYPAAKTLLTRSTSNNGQRPTQVRSPIPKSANAKITGPTKADAKYVPTPGLADTNMANLAGRKYKSPRGCGSNKQRKSYQPEDQYKISSGTVSLSRGDKGSHSI